MLVRKSVPEDFDAILAIVNDAARAYRGIIPEDRWRDPYMPDVELTSEIADGVVFWVAEHEGQLLGVMGIQDRGDVALVRHAYVATTLQRKGVGTRLLRHVLSLTDKPILIGTWADASWAIDFYRRHGFTILPKEDKDRLLRTYWSIPERQIETSVVLAMTIPPKPSGYSTVSPYLIAAGAQAVIDFLKRTFDAEELRRYDLPDGSIMHAEVRIGDTVVMIGEAGKDWPPVPAHLHVYVDDVDATYRRALEAGGVAVQAPTRKGEDPDRRGGVKDPAGNTWWIATQVA